VSRKSPSNVAASVQQRLLDKSRKEGEDYQLLLTRFALERYLYRLGLSPHKEKFILKGAMLFPLWGGELHRPTRDLDLHGSGESGVAHLEEVFREVCLVGGEDDGLKFLPETVRGKEIREDQEYDGVRIQLESRLVAARIILQIDIGFGDAVVPDPIETQYPTILDFSAPRIRVYPRELVVAEKYHALVVLGIANSRMKDFFDLWILAGKFSFDGRTLCQAIEATFTRRRTSVPVEIPMGLSEEFCDDPRKQTQWRAFLRKGRFADELLSLGEVVSSLREFLIPPSAAISRKEGFEFRWHPPGPWRE
jgi:hypothetical protein